MNTCKFFKTKIVCTIGPASSDRETISRLCQAGMNVARLNMSHGTAAEIRAAASQVRECAAMIEKPIALLADLQGPKIRLGDLDEPIELAPGERVTFAPADRPRATALPVTYADLAIDLKQGDRILITDGRVELRVIKTDSPLVEAEVVIGGRISSGKGINLPGVHVSAPVLTEKDKQDIELAIEIDVDCLGLSFVRRAKDVREIRDRVPDHILIVAKIEKDVALDDLDGIIDASDVVMVARGDLGTELPFEQVPLVQKRIVRQANEHYRPVIIATQMLETMIERPRPTRAEISDVANAILDGSDALMLAAETAVGRYPVESVEALTRVIEEIESSTLMAAGPTYDVPATREEEEAQTTEVAVAGATVEAVRVLHAPAIVTFTRSGFTARVVSSRRPPVPIIAVTDTERVYRQLSLVWGVLPVLCSHETTYDNMWEAGRRTLLKSGIASEGERVIVTAGVPFHVTGTTNMVKIEVL